jgi:hypothetical protein
MKHLRSITTRPRLRLLALLVLTAVLALSLSACQVGGRATVTLHVQNSSARSATVASIQATSLTPQTQLATVQSFTPISLKVPILQILLSDSGSGAQTELFHCDPNSDPNACKVDLAQNLQAFQDLINTTAQAAAGTYDTVHVVTCTDGQGGSSTSNPIDYTADVTGQAVIGGNTFVTDPTAAGLVGLDNSGSPNPKPVTVGFSGCARDFPLPAPITLQDGQGFTLSLYIDPADIAWIDANPSGNPQTWLPSGCARDANSATPQPPSGPFVCLGYPDLAAAPGDTAPTLERYLVVDGTFDPATMAVRSGGVFGLYFDANGNPLSGYTRFYFDQYPGRLGYMPGTPFKSITDNNDGTLTLSSFGSSATGPGYFEANDFPTAGGNGDYTSSDYDPSICLNGGPCSYTAKLLP